MQALNYQNPEPFPVDKPLSVGIVGAGLIVNNAHLPALANMPGIEIAWIADQSLERAAAMAAAWEIPAAADFGSKEL